MNRRPVVLGLTLLAIALASGCKGAESAELKPAEKRVHVDTVTVSERPVPKELTLTGTLEANQKTDLAANAVGRVTQSFVERGQTVVAGQLLAQLDVRNAALAAAEARANATTAETQVAAAKADCDRYGPLLKKGAITQQEYDRAITQCQTTVSSVEAARARAGVAAQTLGDGSVRAPFAGSISERFVSTGDYVKADTKIVTLIVSDPLRLKLSVPEANVSAVHEGLVVSFETVAVQGRRFESTIKYVGREVRETTRDLVVEAVTPNTDGALMPGMFVTAHLPVAAVTLPVIPRASVVKLGVTDTVFVVVDKHLQQRVVQTGAALGGQAGQAGPSDQIAIREGLTKDEVVVTNPSNATVDGVAVE
jgi:membrane fusion protein (multidrug efflux system)